MQDVASKQFCQSARMILHNIKPEQLTELETIFGRKTSSGIEIPDWLLCLWETATTKRIDFEATVPVFRAQPSKDH
jgi:hypothetical protein